MMLSMRTAKSTGRPCALGPAQRDLLKQLREEFPTIGVRQLAERHGHAWFAHVNLRGVDLGSGKRVLRVGERLHAKYQISLPKDLDEQLG